MDRARIHEGIRRKRFTDILGRNERSELTQMEAAELLGISERTSRRWRERHRESGLGGPDDRRLAPSLRRAPVVEIQRMLGLYREPLSWGEKLHSDVVGCRGRLNEPPWVCRRLIWSNQAAILLCSSMPKYRCSASGGMLPVGSKRRRWLNQPTHSRVANSTASNDCHGPHRWITSASKGPLRFQPRRCRSCRRGVGAHGRSRGDGIAGLSGSDYHGHREPTRERLAGPDCYQSIVVESIIAPGGRPSA